MLCPKCGAQNDDDAVFCAGCGEKLESTATEGTGNVESTAAETTESAEESAAAEAVSAGAVETEQVQTGGDYSSSYVAAEPAAETEEKKAGAKKYIPVVIGVAALIVIVLIAKSLFGGGYKTPIKTLCKNINKQETDLDKYADVVLPKFAMSAYKDIMKVVENSDGGEDAVEAISDSLEDAYDTWEDDYGDHWKVSYEISKKTKLDKDELEDIQDAYGDMRDYLDYIDEDTIDDWVDSDYISSSDGKKLEKCIEKLDKGLKGIKVSKGYKVKARLKIKGKDDDDKETVEFYIIKADGKWVIDITNGGSSSSLYGYLSYLY